MKAALRLILGLLILAPFVVLLGPTAPWHSQQPWSELVHQFWGSVFYTTLVALVTSVCVLVLGFWGARGLVGRQSSKPLVLFLLMPVIVPVLFVVLAAFRVTSAMGFPFGFWGIVFIHTWIHTGLATLGIHQIFLERLGGWSELALVEGASPTQLFSAAWPAIRTPVLLLGFGFFVSSFSSFTTPLLVGNPQNPVVEVFIYEVIRQGQGLAPAVVLSMIQGAVILALGLLIARSPVPRTQRQVNLSLLASPVGLALPLLLSAILFLSSFWGLSEGLKRLFQFLPVLDFLRAASGSIVIGIGVGLGALFLLILVLFCLPHKNFEKLISGSFAPSSILFGFSFVVLGWTHSLTGIIFALSLVYLGGLFRFRIEGAFHSLAGQMDIARTLGANHVFIFRTVVLPQLSGELGLAAGLAALWAVGDYAISQVISGRANTLGLLLGETLSSYRLDVAAALAWMTAAIGFALMWFFWRMGDVLSRRAH